MKEKKISWKNWEVVKAKQRRSRGDILSESVSGGRELGRILQKVCAFDPQDRYQSPQEMYRELKNFYRVTVQRRKQRQRMQIKKTTKYLLYSEGKNNVRM